MSGGGTFFSLPPFFSPFTFTSCCLGSLPGRHGRYVQHPVDVGPEAAVPVALALDKLYEASLLEKVQVALDRPGASGEPPGQGIHARPAQATLVVGVIGEGAVGGDHLRRDPSEHEVADLGDTGKVRSHRHTDLPVVVRRCALG